MSLLASVLAADPARSIHWLFPELKEIIWGVPASIVIGVALWKFGGPPIRKAMADRTEAIRQDLDGAAAAKAAADVEAAEIRQAAGDIATERDRLLSEADELAAAVLTEGRQRLDLEVAELSARASADVAAAGGRATDEMRAEVARIAAGAADRVLADGLDDDTQQALIEGFISRVGAMS